MVLVAPMGIRPPEGEIFDFFQVMAPQHLVLTVHDADAHRGVRRSVWRRQGPEQFENWEEARAQTARLAWMPFMHNPSLPHLLPAARNLPTQIIWGREDRMVPLSALEPIRHALKDAQVKIFDGCGHRPEVERTAEFIETVESFSEIGKRNSPERQRLQTEESAMHVMYFTERPYRYVPNDEVIKNGFFRHPEQAFRFGQGRAAAQRIPRREDACGRAGLRRRDAQRAS